MKMKDLQGADTPEKRRMLLGLPPEEPITHEPDYGDPTGLLACSPQFAARMEKEKPAPPKKKAEPFICAHCLRPILPSDKAQRIGTSWYHIEDRCYAEELDARDFDREN